MNKQFHKIALFQFNKYLTTNLYIVQIIAFNFHCNNNFKHVSCILFFKTMRNLTFQTLEHPSCSIVVGECEEIFAHCCHIGSLRQSHTEPHRSSFIIHQLNLKYCPCVVIGSSLSLPQPQFVFIEHQQSSISKQTVDGFHKAQNRSNYTQHRREERFMRWYP